MAFGSKDRVLGSTNVPPIVPEIYENPASYSAPSLGLAAPLKMWPRAVEARTPAFDRYRKDIHIRLAEQLGEIGLLATEGEQAMTAVAGATMAIIKEIGFPLNDGQIRVLVDEIVDDVVGFGRLSPLLREESITEIMVNGHDRVFVEVNGELRLTDVEFSDADELKQICSRMASRVGRVVDTANPRCDARTPDGSRINIVFPPVAVDGPYLTVRKFRKDPLTLDKLVQAGSVTPEAAEVIRVIGKCRLNTLISGGTGSGKTTLLNCVSNFVQHGERIVVCEDTSELQLQHPHYIRHETRTNNMEGVGSITMDALVQNALRQRPDRIIVGEVRGGEAFHLLQAMNTGHSGSMGTIHANTPRLALSRLETLVMMAKLDLPSSYIRQSIADVINVVIQTERLRDGSRRVTKITELTGSMEGGRIQTQDLFESEIKTEANGEVSFRLFPTGIARPRIMEQAEYFGEGEALRQALKG